MDWKWIWFINGKTEGGIDAEPERLGWKTGKAWQSCLLGLKAVAEGTMRRKVLLRKNIIAAHLFIFLDIFIFFDKSIKIAPKAQIKTNRNTESAGS